MRISSLLFFFFFFFTLKAQETSPVTWSFSLEAKDENTFDVSAHAIIEPGWKLYSHYIEEGGPIPTDLEIDTSATLLKMEDIKETGHKYGPDRDPVFDMEVSYFKEEAEFTRRVAFQRKPERIKGMVLYMVCNDQECLPPREVAFELIP